MAEPGGQRFPRSLRLLDRREFLRVQGGGTRVSAELLLALATKATAKRSRVGFTVSGKVGNAVVRNRIRRRLRELYRKRREQLPAGLDVVLIAKNAAAKADFEQLSRSFDLVVKQLARRFS